MCGIAGAVSLTRTHIPNLDRALRAMSSLIAHRGPDGFGIWRTPDAICGLAHRRLAIIDLSATGHQPMSGPNGTAITYNGEIYNYLELMDQLASGFLFRYPSNTETILG